MDNPRSPIVSLELLLAPAVEARVRAEWQALADAGLSSLAAHTSPSNRPHVTIAVRSALSFEAKLALPVVTLGAPILFGTGERRVLARSVVPTAELLDFHSAVHALLGPGDDAPHTEPGEWMPHVTLARRLRVSQLPAALELLEAVDGAEAGAAAALRRWDAASATVTQLLP